MKRLIVMGSVIILMGALAFQTEVYKGRADLGTVIVLHIPHQGEVGHTHKGWFHCEKGDC